MFERFTQEARQTVVTAQEQARRTRADAIGPEHLLLAIAGTHGAAAATLAASGLDQALLAAVVSRPSAEQLDADALAAIGIDLDAVRQRADDVFGPGALDAATTGSRRRADRRWFQHVPLTRDAKKAIELSLREAIHLGDREIGAEHLLLGIARADADTLRAVGVDPDALRTALETGRRAAG